MRKSCTRKAVNQQVTKAETGESEMEKLVYEVDAETQTVDTRDTVKHIERIDRLFVTRTMLMRRINIQQTWKRKAPTMT